MKIIECPRDALQGLPSFIPTEDKISYINTLLKVGFSVVDFGSFVSPKAIPQMRDTAEVLNGLTLSETKSKLLAIIANVRGASEALSHKEIDYLGFPLSISETFQKRNTNKSIKEALQTVAEIQKMVKTTDRSLVVYISMGFGNPYGEAYDVGVVTQFINHLAALDVKTISLADTIGVATPKLIHTIFSKAIRAFPNIEIGAHFHSMPQKTLEKIEAAYAAGCNRIDGAIGGMGGCPMAKDDLTGNLATEIILAFCQQQDIKTSVDTKAFDKAVKMKNLLFG
ncbi:MAG: hydroxymethylglutaryl-CoA lyase [Bacteroidota bacterium]